MSDMKCTKCNSDLEQIADFFICTNPHCTLCGDKNIWQELITTRKALDVAVDTLERIASEECKYPIGAAAGTIIRIEQINEITKGNK